MTFLRRFALSLILVLSVPAVYAPLAQAQSPSVITKVSLTFTTIDVPGAGYTGVLGINTAGDMVGDYGQSTNVDAHGFEFKNGLFTYFDYLGGQNHTSPSGINDSGLIVGSAGQNPVVGFLYDGTTFTTLQHGSDNATFTRGLNNAGLVVGGAGTIYTTKAFKMRSGRYKPLNVPGVYVYVSASGINSFGDIVGWTDYNGFVCHPGNCRIMDFPGASMTQALGINDNGVIVGWYDIPQECVCAFAMKKGKYISFSYPGAAGTFAYGINTSGQIVGAYTFDYQVYHGFVTSPLALSAFE